MSPCGCEGGKCGWGPTVSSGRNPQCLRLFRRAAWLWQELSGGSRQAGAPRRLWSSLPHTSFLPVAPFGPGLWHSDMATGGGGGLACCEATRVCHGGLQGCYSADGVRSRPSQDRGRGQTLHMCSGVPTRPLWLGCGHALPWEPAGMLMPLCLNKSRSLLLCTHRRGGLTACSETSHLPGGAGPRNPPSPSALCREHRGVGCGGKDPGISRSTAQTRLLSGLGPVGLGLARTEQLMWRAGGLERPVQLGTATC